jgi:SAM-dependent methyltransferase
MDPDLHDLKDSYDQVAEEYIARIFHELEHKPLDREILDRFAANVQGLGPVCDMGCGPGHVSRYLHDQGVNVLGIDLSPRMVELAWQLNPGIEFRQGNMLALDVEDETWGGIVAFYALIHIPRDQVVRALQELRRVLRPNGNLLVSFHLGPEDIHLDEWWGKKVSVDFIFFQREEMAGFVQSAGFEITDVIERPPYDGVEYPSRRVYIFAHKPREEASHD